MTNLKYIITYTYNLMANTRLTFDTFSFSCFDVMIAFACLGLVAWFLRKIFS